MLACPCRRAALSLLRAVPGGSGCAHVHGALPGQRSCRGICVAAGCDGAVGAGRHHLQPTSHLPAGMPGLPCLSFVIEAMLPLSSIEDRASVGATMHAGAGSSDGHSPHQFLGECWRHDRAIRHRQAAHMSWAASGNTCPALLTPSERPACACRPPQGGDWQLHHICVMSGGRRCRGRLPCAGIPGAWQARGVSAAVQQQHPAQHQACAHERERHRCREVGSDQLSSQLRQGC